MMSFFGSFLDGFTGAGLARKLTIPGEPILGFAPGARASEEKPLSQVSRGNLLVRIGKKSLQLRVLDIQRDNKPGSFVVTTESASGRVRRVHLEGDALSANLSSVVERPVG